MPPALKTAASSPAGSLLLRHLPIAIALLLADPTGCPASEAFCRFLGIGHGPGYHANDCPGCCPQGSLPGQLCFSGRYPGAYGYPGYRRPIGPPYYNFSGYYGQAPPPYTTTPGPPIITAPMPEGYPADGHGAMPPDISGIELAPGEVLIAPPQAAEDSNETSTGESPSSTEPPTPDESSDDASKASVQQVQRPAIIRSTPPAEPVSAPDSTGSEAVEPAVEPTNAGEPAIDATVPNRRETESVIDLSAQSAATSSAPAARRPVSPIVEPVAAKPVVADNFQAVEPRTTQYESAILAQRAAHPQAKSQRGRFDVRQLHPLMRSVPAPALHSPR